MNEFLSFEVDDAGLDRLSWHDFGNGLSMARLAREKNAELVLYRIQEDASPDAFLKHEHLGGEFYLVLKGKIADETGEYQRGDVVFLAAQSAHTPRAIGETVVLVLWPAGVRILD
ncbi:MAG TPA: cupin domain-containing protein [Candidatus Binatia bacterium]|nr:cupin domain-containing protein [Candidatus Binatia bacterium]